MHEFLPSTMATWGAEAVFLNALITRLGVPIPTVPILVLAGTAIASHTLSFWPALFGAVCGALAGDGLWFAAGRYYGERIFSTLARLSPYIEVTVRKAHSTFERFGVSITAVSKFVPGLAFITPPLMGTTRVDPRIYAAWDVMGTTVWAAFWLLGGVLAQKQWHVLLHVVETHDVTLINLLAAILAGYAALRLMHRWRLRRLFERMRHAAQAIGTPRLHAKPSPVVLDARPESLRPDATHSVTLAQPIDLNCDEKVDEALMADDAVIYCVCADHASADEIGHKMRKKGFTRIRTVEGDLDAWRRRGYPIGSAPQREVTLVESPGTPPEPRTPHTVRCVAPKRPQRP
jgi:membrane protein DedA with SNARE-associated domain/rhodanese-related sulfurtransferase